MKKLFNSPIAARTFFFVALVAVIIAIVPFLVSAEWLKVTFNLELEPSKEAIYSFGLFLLAIASALAGLSGASGKATDNNEKSKETKDFQITRDKHDHQDSKQTNPFLSNVETACRLQLKDSNSKITVRNQPNFPHLHIETTEYGILKNTVVAIIEHSTDESNLGFLIDRIDTDYRNAESDLEAQIVYGGEYTSEELKQLAISHRIKLIHFPQYKGLLDFNRYLSNQQKRLENSEIYPPSLYVDQRMQYGDRAEPDTSESAITTLNHWLQQDNGQLILILGDFGTGKTFLLREMARRFNQDNQQQNPIPILLEMRSLEKTANLDQLLAQQLASDMTFDAEKFRYMLNQGQIILFFDGFDELALRVTYDTALQHFDTILQAAQGENAKVIVSSRTQHFINKSQVERQLLKHLKQVKSHRIVELQGFNKKQIRCYLENHLGDKAKAEHYYQTIDHIKDLMGLSENPRMLSFILRLSEEQLESAKDEQGEITAADLYELILNDWLNLEQKRVKTGRKDDLTLDHRWDAVTKLALLLWERTEKTIRLDDLSTDVVETLQSLTQDCDTATHKIASGTLLTRDEEENFGFIHQSVMEWLLARDMSSALENGQPELLRKLLGLQSISELMADFLCDLIGKANLADWVESKRAYKNNPPPNLEKNPLKKPPKAGKHPTKPEPPKSSILQKNIRTISNRLDIRNHVVTDYSGQDLQGEDFSNQNLTKANFAGANLQRVNFDNAILNNANFTGADCQYTSFKSANCQQADFSKATLDYSSFNHANLEQTIFTDATLYAASLLGAKSQRSIEPAIFKAESSQRLKWLGASNAKQAPWGSAWSTQQSLNPQHKLAISGLSVAHHPKLNIIAITSGSTITLWDSDSGDCLNTLSGHNDWVRSVSFSPDGSLLLSGSDDNTLKLWNADSGDCLNTLSGHQDYVSSVSFSPDGSCLLSGSSDKTLKLWNVDSGDCLKTLLGHQDSVRSVAFSPDSSCLVSGSSDKTLKLWNVDSGDCLKTLLGHQGYVRSVAFSSDGSLLLSGSSDKTLKLWSMDSGDCLKTFLEHENIILSVAFSSDGIRLLSGSEDKTLKLWNTFSDNSMDTFSGHQDSVRSVAFSPDGSRLLSGSSDNTLKLWNVDSGYCLSTFSGNLDYVRSVAFSPDGSRLLSGSSDNTLKLWNVDSGYCLNTLSGHNDWVRSVAFSPDGRHLLSGSSDSTLKLWNADSGDCLNTLSGHQNSVISVAFSPDGRYLLSGSSDNTLKLWNANSGDCLNTLLGHNDWVKSVAFSSDNNRLLSGASDKALKLWNANSGDCLNTLSGHQGTIWSVAFSPDDSRLLSGSSDKTLKLWNANSGDCLNTLLGHKGSVISVAFSPDGGSLLSGSSDNSLKLWNAYSGDCLNTLSGHQGAIWSVAFSPDGKWIISGSDDGSIRIWRVADGACVAILAAFKRGWVAYTPEGKYRYNGNLQGNFWHTIGLCRFEVDELDPYWHESLKLKDNEPLYQR